MELERGDGPLFISCRVCPCSHVVAFVDIEFHSPAHVRLTRACVCGSDLHLYHGLVPDTRVGSHKSTEHARLPPVFGTSCPPVGLRGKLRDVAYRYSEGRFARWLTLMLADRVDVVEDLFKDLLHLQVPNLPREMGLRWRYNRAAFVRKATTTGRVDRGANCLRERTAEAPITQRSIFVLRRCGGVVRFATLRRNAELQATTGPASAEINLSRLSRIRKSLNFTKGSRVAAAYLARHCFLASRVIGTAFAGYNKSRTECLQRAS